jgi:hypothetical protein
VQSCKVSCKVSPLRSERGDCLVLGLVLKGSKDPDAGGFALILARQLAAEPDGNGCGLIKPLLPQLLRDFPEIVWPLFGQAIVSDRMMAWRFEQRALVTAIRSKTSSSVQYWMELAICCIRIALVRTTAIAMPVPPLSRHLSEDTHVRVVCHAHPDPSPSGYWTSSVIGRFASSRS